MLGALEACGCSGLLTHIMKWFVVVKNVKSGEGGRDARQLGKRK